MVKHETYLFGPFCLSMARRELGRHGKPVRLGPRAFNLLAALVRRYGDVATKDELIAEIWPDVVVEENNLSVQIAAVRKALGDRPARARFVATVARRGYRFVAPVVRAYGVDAGTRSTGRSCVIAAPTQTSDKPSVLVAPFRNLSARSEPTRIEAGIVEELLTALSRCTSLRVVAPGLPQQPTGNPEAHYVLGGSIRRSGDRLRVACQLNDVVGGAQIWADSFSGAAGDAFGLQDRIAFAVAGIIEPQIQLAEMARRRHKMDARLGPYDHLLRAQELEYEFTAASFDQALDHLRRALDIDPLYAEAMAFAAYCFGWRRTQGWMKDPAAETAEGLRLMRRALELGHFDPNVLWMSAFAAFQLGADPHCARELAYQSIAANPNAAASFSVAGRLEIYLGRYAIGKDLVRRAHSLNPRNPRLWHLTQAMALASLGEARFEQSARWAQKVLTQNPRHTGAMRVLAADLAHLGRIGSAAEILDRNFDIEPDLTITKLHRRRLFQHAPLWQTFSQGLRLAGMPE